MRILGRATAALLLLSGCHLHPAAPSLEIHAPGGHAPNGRIELKDSSAAASSFRLRLADASDSTPDILGEAKSAGDRVLFTPRFPLQPGLAYRVLAQGTAPLDLRFELPKLPQVPSTRVARVAPSLAQVPSNLLKFYLHFSAPMRRGGAYEHVRLLDESGAAIEGAFLEIEPELWNPERTRLTLLIDPGRIKRGLLLHEQLGPVMEPERSYELQVDADWRDDEGVPLVASWRHGYSTTATDLHSPLTDRWSWSPPRAGTREALRIAFDEPLDRALALRLLWIKGPDGVAILGLSELASDQVHWEFVPDQPWNKGPHHVVVSAVLEDLAGNSIGRPFESGTSIAERASSEDMDVSLPFSPAE